MAYINKSLNIKLCTINLCRRKVTWLRSIWLITKESAFVLCAALWDLFRRGGDMRMAGNRHSTGLTAATRHKTVRESNQWSVAQFQLCSVSSRHAKIYIRFWRCIQYRIHIRRISRIQLLSTYQRLSASEYLFQQFVSLAEKGYDHWGKDVLGFLMILALVQEVFLHSVLLFMSRMALLPWSGSPACLFVDRKPAANSNDLHIIEAKWSDVLMDTWTGNLIMLYAEYRQHACNRFQYDFLFILQIIEFFIGTACYTRLSRRKMTSVRC